MLVSAVQQRESVIIIYIYIYIYSLPLEPPSKFCLHRCCDQVPRKGTGSKPYICEMPRSPDGRAPLCHSILSHFSPRTCSASKYMFNPSLETVWKFGFQVLALVDNIYPFRHAVLLDLGLCKNSGTSRAMKIASETTAGLAMSEGGGIWAEKKKDSLPASPWCQLFIHQSGNGGWEQAPGHREGSRSFFNGDNPNGT